MTTESDLDRLLERVASVARDVTGVRHAGLGVLSADGTKPGRIVAPALDGETRAVIEAAASEIGWQQGVVRTEAAPPDQGRAAASETLRLLAVPIFVRGRAWGQLYLLDEDPGKLTGEEEQLALVLSALTSLAIDHAQLLDHLPARPEQVRHEVRRAEAMTAMARVLGQDPTLQGVLDLVAEEGREFVQARVLVAFLPTGDQLVAASAAANRRLVSGILTQPVEGSVTGRVLAEREAVRLEGAPEPDELALRRWVGARTGLLVPLVFVGRAIGVLAAFDRLRGGPAFDLDDERLLASFATAAAVAIVTARLAHAEREHRRAGESEHEPGGIARELHDETLQTLGALRLSLSAALHVEDRRELAGAVESAIAQLDREIEDLRRLIGELRPAALEALGVEGAIRALCEQAAEEDGPDVRVHNEATGLAEQFPLQVQHALYRVVQEALTNAVKHADATHVDVDLRVRSGAVEVRVTDDGRGMGTRPGRIGFGLLGMRERVELLGGRFELASSETEGTSVEASLPLRPGRSASEAPQDPARANGL